MTECTYCKESVTPDNVYIIDNGLTLYQVNGSQSDKDERMKAAQFVMKLKVPEQLSLKKRLPFGD